MANNRFNKQVTPKGYKMGGRVSKMGGGMMMQRPMAEGGYITKKKTSKYITRKKPEGKLLPESGSKYITKKPKYITKKKKYITKKSPAEIQDRERVGRKMGGGMMKRPMYKDGSPKTKQEKNFKITKNNIGKIKEAIKKARGEAFKGNVKPFKKGGSAKKKKFENPMKKERAREGMKSQYRKMGFGKLIDDGTIDFSEYKMGGRVKKMGGGSLKPVDPKTQKGLSKLPTEVRNKMGFMKKGGKVK